MLSKNTKLYSLVLVVADFIILLAAFTIAYLIRVRIDNRPLVNPVFAYDYIVMALSIIPFWIIVFASLGLYSSPVYNRRLAEWGRIAIGSVIGILVVIGWEYVTGKIFFPARLAALYALIASFALVLIGRELLRALRSLAFRYGYGISRVLIIGETAATAEIAEHLSATNQSGYKIVGMATPKQYVPYRRGIIHYHDIESALRSIKAQQVDTIIQTDLTGYEGYNDKILSAAQINHVRYSFIPGEPEFYTGKNTVDVFLGYPMISVSQTPLIGWGSIVKRIFDLVFSVLLLIVLSPVFLLLIILQQIFNPGPVLFKHERLTRYSKPFYIYKFRSMIWRYCGPDAAKIFRDMGREDLAKEYEKNFKVEHDPRITPFGNFLRKSSLDELPQLLNVIKGDLSLVGPRPIPKFELDTKFNELHGALLLSVKSGITGLWQVSGRNNLTNEQRAQLELWYVQNWSFWLDIKIMFKTIKVVLSKAGAR